MAKSQGVVRAKDLRAIPEDELQGQLKKLRQELWQDRVKAKVGAVQQTHRFGVLRRQIARIHTVMQESRLKKEQGRS